jgi:hypothetical protein
MWNVFFDDILGVREIQSFLREKHEILKFKESSDKVKNFNIKGALLSNIINASANVFF